MRLMTYTDYTLRVLMYLTVRYKSGELTTISEISKSYDISRNHLTKIVYQLSVNGLIDTTRGRSGGARLTRDPSQISVGQVVRLCEPDFAVVECHEPGKENLCALWQACNLKVGFRRAMDAFLMELDRITLADAVTSHSVAASLLGVSDLRARTIPILVEKGSVPHKRASSSQPRKKPVPTRPTKTGRAASTKG